MTNPALPSKASRNAALAFSGLLLASILGMSLAKGQFGQIGTDGDDIVRLVQIQNYLDGQSWFDVSQPRLGPEGGTQMHWSRLVDIPILLLTALFGLFTTEARALNAAITIWPPLSMGLVIAGIWAGARRLGTPHAVAFCMLAALAILFSHFRFQPGAIDHHNVQLGLMALATGFALTPLRAPRSMAAAGLSLGLAVAIGVEVYAFAAVICAFVALDWAIAGQPARRGAIAFGLALPMTLGACFLATIAPAKYGAVACDALSSITLSAATIGGGGLALAAWKGSAQTRFVRFGLLGLLGIACILLFVMQAPQCAASPLADLPPITRDLWLNNIEEAASLSQSWSQDPLAVPYMFGIILLAIALCVLDLRARRNVRATLLLLALLSTALLLSVEQVRFYVFGHLIAIFPMGLWIGRIWRRGREGTGHAALYIGALALSIPFLWSIPFSLFLPASTSTVAEVDTSCLTDSVLKALTDAPQGRVLAPTSLTPALLLNTEQNVLMGNYHRNKDGIAAGIGIFGGSEENTLADLDTHGIDYLLVCPTDPDMQRYAQVFPNGLAAHFIAGDIPTQFSPLTDGLYKIDLPGK